MENQKISLPPPSPTAYDDAFRTMLNDCTGLIIPVVNLYFNENYTGNEEISFSKNENYLYSRTVKFTSRHNSLAVYAESVRAFPSGNSNAL